MKPVRTDSFGPNNFNPASLTSNNSDLSNPNFITFSAFNSVDNNSTTSSNQQPSIYGDDPRRPLANSVKHSANDMRSSSSANLSSPPADEEIANDVRNMGESDFKELLGGIVGGNFPPTGQSKCGDYYSNQYHQELENFNDGEHEFESSNDGEPQCRQFIGDSSNTHNQSPPLLYIRPGDTFADEHGTMVYGQARAPGRQFGTNRSQTYRGVRPAIDKDLQERQHEAHRKKELLKKKLIKCEYNTKDRQNEDGYCGDRPVEEIISYVEGVDWKQRSRQEQNYIEPKRSPTSLLSPASSVGGHSKKGRKVKSNHGVDADPSVDKSASPTKAADSIGDATSGDNDSSDSTGIRGFDSGIAHEDLDVDERGSSTDQMTPFLSDGVSSQMIKRNGDGTNVDEWDNENDSPTFIDGREEMSSSPINLADARLYADDTEIPNIAPTLTGPDAFPAVVDGHFQVVHSKRKHKGKLSGRLSIDQSGVPKRRSATPPAEGGRLTRSAISSAQHSPPHSRQSASSIHGHSHLPFQSGRWGAANRGGRVLPPLHPSLKQRRNSAESRHPVSPADGIGANDPVSFPPLSTNNGAVVSDANHEPSLTADGGFSANGDHSTALNAATDLARKSWASVAAGARERISPNGGITPASIAGSALHSNSHITTITNDRAIDSLPDSMAIDSDAQLLPYSSPVSSFNGYLPPSGSEGRFVDGANVNDQQQQHIDVVNSTTLTHSIECPEINQTASLLLSVQPIAPFPALLENVTEEELEADVRFNGNRNGNEIDYDRGRSQTPPVEFVNACDDGSHEVDVFFGWDSTLVASNSMDGDPDVDEQISAAAERHEANVMANVEASQAANSALSTVTSPMNSYNSQSTETISGSEAVQCFIQRVATETSLHNPAILSSSSTNTRDQQHVQVAKILQEQWEAFYSSGTVPVSFKSLSRSTYERIQ